MDEKDIVVQNITYPGLPRPNGTTLEPEINSPIQFWYTWEKGFMEMVQPSSWVVDFAINIYNQIYTNGFDSSIITGNLGSSSFIGILILLIIGSLYIVGTIFGGLIFCCCRCCCTSGYQKYDRKGAKCARFSMSFFIFLFSVFLSLGTATLYLSVRDLTSAMDSLPRVVNNSFLSMEKMLDDTISEINFVATDGFQRTQAAMLTDLNEAGSLISAEVRRELESATHISDTISNAFAVGEELSAVLRNLRDLGSGIAEIESQSQNFLSNITQTASKLQSICMELESKGAPQTCLSKGINPEVLRVNLTLNFDFDFANPQQTLQQLEAANITNLALSTQQQYKELDRLISKNVADVSIEIERELRKFNSTLDEQLSNIDEKVKSVKDKLEVARKDAVTYLKVPEQLGIPNYMWYSSIGLTSFFSVLIALTVIAMCTGLCAYDREVLPTKRDGFSKCSSCCMMLVVYITLIFAWLFMVVTIVLFLAGSQTDSVLCPLLQGKVDNYSGIAKVEEVLNGKVDYNMSISSALNKCMNDKSVYEAFQLHSLYDLNQFQQMLDGVDIDGVMSELYVDPSTLQIFGSNTETVLRDFIAQLDRIRFSNQFLNSFTERITLNLTRMAELIEGLMDELTNVPNLETEKQNLTAVAAELKELNSTSDMLNFMLEHSGQIVHNFSNHLNNTVVPLASQTLKGAQLAQSYFNNSAPEKLREVVASYAQRQLHFGQEFVNFATLSIQNDIGRCYRAYVIFDNAANFVCDGTLAPLNGLWFSLGLVLMLLIPTIIVNTCLSKHYRRATRTNVGYQKQPIPVARTEFVIIERKTEPSVHKGSRWAQNKLYEYVQSVNH